LSNFAYECFRDHANTAVGGDHDIERAPGESCIEGLTEMGITVNMFDVVGNFGNLVGAAMEYRHRVAAFLKTVDKKRSARTGATYH
jgi:hypothetical protein